MKQQPKTLLERRLEIEKEYTRRLERAHKAIIAARKWYEEQLAELLKTEKK